MHYFQLPYGKNAKIVWYVFFFSSGNRKSELTFSKTAETECRETSFFKFAEINDPLPHIVILTPDQHASTWIRCQHL